MPGTLRNDESFGICDDENGEKAYTDITNENKWIATVLNENRILLTFTAIDKCILQDSEYPERGRCDGMLTSQNHLFLIELKNQRPPGWKNIAIGQLESTIKFLQEFHKRELQRFKYKKAFACNKRHRGFKVIDHEKQSKFFRKYKFRLDVQTNIMII